MARTATLLMRPVTFSSRSISGTNISTPKFRDQGSAHRQRRQWERALCDRGAHGGRPPVGMAIRHRRELRRLVRVDGVFPRNTHFSAGTTGACDATVAWINLRNGRSLLVFSQGGILFHLSGGVIANLTWKIIIAAIGVLRTACTAQRWPGERPGKKESARYSRLKPRPRARMGVLRGNPCADGLARQRTVFFACWRATP